MFNLLLTMATLLVVSAKKHAGRPTDTQQHYVIDPHGRHVIYHGVNVVYKIYPYIPDEDKFDSQTSLTQKDIEDMRNWGFNLVRLAVMWEAVETAPGVYNQTYLQEIDALINNLGNAGIYTLIDAHQDVMARVICGEGMPNFYAKEIIANGTYCLGPTFDKVFSMVYDYIGFCRPIDSYNFRKDADGNPLIEDCQTFPFFQYYTSPESFSIFRALWFNWNGLQDKYVAYWDAVAQVLAKNQYVIGFDPLNEPLPSWTSVSNALSTIWPNNGYFDKYDLQPMYERIYASYMKYSNNYTYMWFEPGQIPDEVGINKYLNWVFDLGFTKPPGGEIGSPTHVLNDHSYCCQIVGTCDETGEPQMNISAAMCEKWHNKRLDQRRADADKYGVPLAISEFGACMDTDDCVKEIELVTDACDRHLASWAYWEFKTYKDLTTSAGDRSEGFYNFDGTLQLGKVKSLTRTYVQTAQGVTKEMQFDTKSANFSALVHIDLSVNAPTTIYVHTTDENMETTWYPNGYDISLTNADETGPAPQINKEKGTGDNYFAFLITNKEFDKNTLKVVITPKAAQPAIDELIM